MASTSTTIGFSSHSNTTGKKDSHSDGARSYRQAVGQPRRTEENKMKCFTHRMQVVTLLAGMFSAFTMAAGQNKSPVAPSEQAYANILKEAYDNFKNDTSGK